MPPRAVPADAALDGDDPLLDPWQAAASVSASSVQKRAQRELAAALSEPREPDRRRARSSSDGNAPRLPPAAAAPAAAAQGGTDNERTPSPSGLASARLRSEILEGMAGLLDAKVLPRLAALDDRTAETERKVDEHDVRLASLEASMARLNNASRNTEAAISELGEAVSLASNADPAVAERADDFDRATDMSLLLLRVADACTREAIERKIGQLTKRAAIPKDTWKILEDDALATRWTLQFSGVGSTAGKRVAKMLGCLRDGAGFFERCYIDLPDGAQTELWLDRDKNRQQVFREIEMTIKAKPEEAAKVRK